MESIRVSEITQPSSEKISLNGRVSRVFGPKYFCKIAIFECIHCLNQISIPAQFPYEEDSPPRTCNQCGGRRIERKVPSGEFEMWHKIHFQEKGTTFILILVGDNQTPNKGDEITFSTMITPKLGKSLIISTWTGESSTYTVNN